MYDNDAEVPDYVPIQNRQSWRLVWHRIYDAKIADGEDETTAQVLAFVEADFAYGRESVTNIVQEAAMPEVLKLEKFFQVFRVVDKADGSHEVIGICTSEAEDHDGEIADFQDTLKSIQAWSDDAAKTTKAAGQEISLGNIRVQHDPSIIGGKVTQVEPDNKGKAITIATEPRKSIYDEYIAPGYVKAFSIAGSYLYRRCNDCGSDIEGRGRWCAKCKKDVKVRYAPGDMGKPGLSEISYVDKGSNPDAVFQHVKVDGGMQLVKFADLEKAAAGKCKCDCKECKTKGCKECSHPGCDCENCDCPQKKADAGGVRAIVEDVLISAGVIKKKKTKRVDGKDLSAKDFAWVGDPDDPSTWKLPIHDASHCRNALARFNQTQGIPADQKAKVKAKIVARAKHFGIEVSEKSKKCVRYALVKVIADYFRLTGLLSRENSETKAEAASIEDCLAAAESAVAKVEEVFCKVDGEAKLFKGLYTVSQLAEILQGLQWIVASTEYEREFEGDDSQVPDDLRGALEDLVPIFIAMATEEANELLAQGKKTQKAANGGEQGGTSMSEPNADLLKAAKELLAEFMKKAKSLFHKCATCHKGLMKAHETRGDHHKSLSDHHAAMSEAAADVDSDKSVKNELEKLRAGSDFAKMDELAKREAECDVLAKSKNPQVAAHARCAKAHMGLHKTSMKAAGHHDDLHKAHNDLGDSAPDTQSRSKEEDEAHGGGSEKSVSIEDFRKMLQDELKPVKDEVAAVKADVDKHMGKLTPGPGDNGKAAAAAAGATGGTPNPDDKNKSNGGDGEKSFLAKKASGAARESGSVGIFSK